MLKYLNQVSQADLNRLRQLEPNRGDELIESVGAVTACFGFFNRFNDLIGVELEAPALEAAQDSLGSQWEVGKHDSQDRSDSSCSLEENAGDEQKIIEQEQAFIAQVHSSLEAVIGQDLRAYLQENLGIVPNGTLTKN